MTDIQTDDAVRPSGSWGVWRVLALRGGKALLTTDNATRGRVREWHPIGVIEFLHNGGRWAEGES